MSAARILERIQAIRPCLEKLSLQSAFIKTGQRTMGEPGPIAGRVNSESC